MEKVVQVHRSFQAAEKAGKAYCLSLTPRQRLEILLELIRQGQHGETEQRLERVCRIVKLNKQAVGRPQDIADLAQILPKS